MCSGEVIWRASFVVPGVAVVLAPGRTLRLRWLGGHVSYRDAHALQRALWAAGFAADDWLLLLEHSHVYTAGIRTKPEHMLVDPATVGAELLWVDRGGDITYHGPGQLVGYPVFSVPSGPSATPCYVHDVEQLVIDVLAGAGLPDVGRLDGYPGVWVGPDGPRPRKICAVGARHSRQRTMHGFALNVNPSLAMFSHIVPCGIAGKEVTSLEAEGVHVSMADVVEAVFEAATQRWGVGRPVERQDAAMPASMRVAAGGRGPALSGPVESADVLAVVNEASTAPVEGEQGQAGEQGLGQAGEQGLGQEGEQGQGGAFWVQSSLLGAIDVENRQESRRETKSAPRSAAFRPVAPPPTPHLPHVVHDVTPTASGGIAPPASHPDLARRRPPRRRPPRRRPPRRRPPRRRPPRRPAGDLPAGSAGALHAGPPPRPPTRPFGQAGGGRGRPRRRPPPANT